MELSLQLILSLLLIVSIHGLGELVLEKLNMKRAAFINLGVGLILFITALSTANVMEINRAWAGLLLVPGLTQSIRALRLKLTSGFFKGVLAFAFISACVLLQAIIMGSNANYPNYYFNVDTPFAMTVAKSMLIQEAYPPALLDNAGEGLKYHFGYYNLLSFWHSATGMPLHRIHAFVLAPGLMAMIFGLLAQSFQFIAKQKTNVAIALAFLVYLGFQQYLFNYLKPSTVLNLITFPERYKALFPLVPNLFEPIYLLLVFWFIRINTLRGYWVSAFLIATIPIFKIPLAAPIGLGFGLYLLIKAIREKQLKLLLIPAFTAVFMLIIFKLFASNGQAVEVTLFSATHVLKDHWFAMLIPIVIALGAFLESKNLKALIRDNWTSYFLFVLPMPFLLLFINIQDHNAWQLITISSFASWFLGVMLLTTNWESFSKRVRKSLVVIGCTVLIIPSLNIVYSFYSIRKSAMNAGEVANNELLATKLSTIPVKEMVLATNDLRYPANNYHRPEAQMQFSALFGHQMYLSNLHYIISPEFAEVADSFLEKVPQKQPSLSDEKFLRSCGVTHYVLAVCDSSKEYTPVMNYVVYPLAASN